MRTIWARIRAALSRRPRRPVAGYREDRGIPRFGADDLDA